MQPYFLEGWRRALRLLHGGSRGHDAALAFLRDPGVDTKHNVGLWTVHGELAQKTLDELAKLEGDARASALTQLAALRV